MRIFFDRNACCRTARMLGIYSQVDAHQVVHHDDDRRFHRRSKDTEIIRTLHSEDPDWILLGGDGTILRNKAELAVLTECNLTYALLNKSWGRARVEDSCWMMIKIWPSLLVELAALKVHSVLDLKYASTCRIDNRGPTAELRPR